MDDLALWQGGTVGAVVLMILREVFGFVLKAKNGDKPIPPLQPLVQDATNPGVRCEFGQDHTRRLEEIRDYSRDSTELLRQVVNLLQKNGR